MPVICVKREYNAELIFSAKVIKKTNQYGKKLSRHFSGAPKKNDVTDVT